MKYKAGDRVRAIGSANWCGDFWVRPGDILTLVGHGNSDDPFFRRFLAFAHDDSNLVNSKGQHFLRILASKVEPLEGNSPAVCTCDLWKGCTCGVFAAKMESVPTVRSLK